MIVKGKAGIEAEVLLKSEGTHSFISTLRIRFPRFVAEQFLKHRMFSCNAVSSRALSVPKMNQWILNNTSEPIFWGAQKKGMQPDQEHNQLLRDADDYNSYIDLDGSTPEEAWYNARNYTMSLAKAYWEAGYHQQIPNRLTHPFQMAEYIVTATDFDNFFNLRLYDKAAQSEITELARCMKKAIDKAPVMELIEGWHIPYLTEDDLNCLTLPEMLKVSAARCAIISYNNHDSDQLLPMEKAEKIYKHLINDTNPHYTPMEHQARVLSREELDIYWAITGATMSIAAQADKKPHMRDFDTSYFGNLKMWKSQRYLLETLDL